MNPVFVVAARLVATLHLAFVLFVALGGYLLLLDARVIWLHLPVMAYGVLIEWVGWTCPFTPLEKRLRHLAGLPVYEGDFTEHYILPWLPLPGRQERAAKWVGLGIIGLNLVAYGLFFWRGA
ncbi:MAG: DUF2784 domain-containing protein [Gammaproteobacteria bacterium]|nr:DUF2784 domain-containing protein [Gammaproteobacteria bacterium]